MYRSTPSMHPPKPDPLALHRLDQGRGHAAAIGELLEGRGARSGRRRRERPRPPQQDRRRPDPDSPDDPSDRGQGQPFPLQGADLADPIRMLRAVPSDTALSNGNGEQPERLVVPNGVDGNVARGGELLHPVPHDQPLYECSLARSTRRPPATMRGVERVGRPVSLVLILACTCGTMILGGALKGPCASGSWGDGRQYRLAVLLRYRAAAETPSSSPGTDFRSSSSAWRRGGQCDEYPVLTMYFMRVAAWVGGSTTAGFFTANAVLLLGVCRRDRHVPVHAGRQGVLVRARAHAADLRLHELGSVRGGVRDRSRLLPSPAVDDGLAGVLLGPRCRREVLSGDACPSADRAAAARPRARRARSGSAGRPRERGCS